MNPTTGTTPDNGGTLQPFQRNRYFYGKLMMVRDFLAEQVYMNGKRNLINRLVNGWGVVCGLGASAAAGSTSVTVSPGVAVDCCGREIVVSDPYTVDQISSLDGYAASATLDLCISYAECLREPVAALANASTCEESCEYNRVQETFKLSLREAPAAQPTAESSFCSLGTATSDPPLLDSALVRITRVVPQWVNPGEVFPVTLQVSVKADTASLSVTITENLPPALTLVQGLSAAGVATISGNTLKSGDTLTHTYLLQAPQTTGTIPVPQSPSTIVVQGGAPVSSDPASGASVQVIAGPVTDQLVAAYFSRNLASCPTCTQDDALVLLRFNVDSSGKIASPITPAPLSQYVYDNLLLYYMAACAGQRIGQVPSMVSARHKGTLIQPGVTNLNFLDGFSITAPADGEADVQLSVGNGLKIVLDQVQPDYAATSTPGKVCEASDPRLSNARPPLPHAATHQAGGSDVINVNNLSGVLAQAQRVEALLNGNSVAVRPRLNFTGGVTVTDDAANNWALVNVSGGTAAPPAHTNRVSITLDANGSGSAIVDSGFANSLFTVVLGVDSIETARYGDNLINGGKGALDAVVFETGSQVGRFQIQVQAGAPSAAISIRWFAIPAQEFGPTITITIPTFTLTPTVTIPTLTIPTVSPTLTIVPTFTVPPTFTIVPTATIPTVSPTLTIVPTFTVPPTLTVVPTATLPHPTLTIGPTIVPHAVATVPGPLGGIPTGSGGVAGPIVIVPPRGGVL